MFNKNETCCFTGHRNISTELYPNIKNLLKCQFFKVYSDGIRNFIAGGALGFDMICAEVVLELKETYEDITLTLAIPCHGHDAKWKERSRNELSRIMERADEVVYVSEQYEKGCMFRRNRYMVDRSCICISCCTKSTGGSRYTVDYALSSGIEVIELSTML